MTFIYRTLFQTISLTLKIGLLLALICCTSLDLVLGLFGTLPACPIERNSCASPSADQLPWYQRNCYCDDSCTLYDDCCPDFTSISQLSNSSTGPANVTSQEGRDVKLFVLSPEVIGCQALGISYRQPLKDFDKIVSEESEE